MKIKILTGLLVLLAVLGHSFAGVKLLTHHSRANCLGFNETVSWHAGHHYWFWVNSRHRFKNGKLDHQTILGWINTWRAANYHWPEGSSGGWTVEGHHWMRNSQASMPYQVTQEFVADCSIYDGWWD